MTYGTMYVGYDDTPAPRPLEYVGKFPTLRDLVGLLWASIFGAWAQIVGMFVEYPTSFCIRYWGAVFLSGTCSFAVTTVAVFATLRVVF